MSSFDKQLEGRKQNEIMVLMGNKRLKKVHPAVWLAAAGVVGVVFGL